MAKMLVSSPEFQCSNEILTIVAMLSGALQLCCTCASYLWDTLSVPNVFQRPNNMRKEADAAKALLSIPDGDHLSLLNVYNSYKTSKLFCHLWYE